MSYEYSKQNWKTYDKTLPTRLQEDSVITKKRLDHMEDGIERNSMSLEIGDLIVGDSSVPSASFEVDEESKERRLNIIFPKSSEIEDNTIKDDATWSSRKIRSEIDAIAANTHYTCEVISNEGLIFASATEAKTLVAKIYKTGEDITSSCDEDSMVWKRVSDNTDYDDFWNGKNYTGRNVVISASELNEVSNATFYCTYTGINEEGATIEATGSLTLVNMIYEPTDTSVSFTLNAPKGTVFDNNSGTFVELEAIAYIGSTQITEADASFRWYLNGVWIPDQVSSKLSYPIVGISLVSTFTCEMRYKLATYKNSITVQNRKNVTVSDKAPNDPYLGDIWYDTVLEVYKKWTASGWEIIQDPQSEVTGEILIAVEAVKTSYETELELEEVRKATYYENENGELKTIVDFYNMYKETAEETTRTIQAIYNTAEGAKEIASSASQTASKFSWLVSGEDETSFTLTDRFAELLSDEIKISGENITLNGMTTINGDVQITEEGYLIAKSGGAIGPWSISNDNIYWTDDEDPSTKIIFGINGLNLSDKLKLTQEGGFDSKNFKIDPLTDSVELDAQVIKLGGTDVLIATDEFGIRNLILTSGSYQLGKTNLWNVENIPWSMIIGPVTEEITEAQDVAEVTTYVTFTKSEIDSEEILDDQYIRLPLSESPSVGNYSFCIRAFGSDSLNDPITLKMYLLTEDNQSKLIGSFTINDTETTSCVNYYQSDRTQYKYVGFKSSEYSTGDSINIINLGLYKSKVMIKDWQPAPEDTSMGDIDNKNDMSGNLNTVTMRLEVFEDSMSTIFNQTETPVILTEEDINAFIDLRVPGMVESAVMDRTTSILETIDGISTQWDKKLTIQTSDGTVMVADLFQYINLANGAIELGNNARSTKLLIYSGDVSEDASISFKDGSTTLGTFAKNMLLVDQIDTEKINIGNFQIFSRENGNVSIRKVGITEAKSRMKAMGGN